MTDTTIALDTDEFESRFAAAVGASVAGFEVVHDGLNLLVAVRTDSGESYILRQPRKLRKSGYMADLETEYAVLERLNDTSIPTPTPVLFCEDESVLGDEFFLMTRLDGETVPNGVPLPERFRTPESRKRIGTCLIDTLSDIHSLDPEPFAETSESRTPLEKIENALERLDVAESVIGREWPRLQRVGDWLRRNAPTNSEMRLVHGDFRPSNVLLGETSIPEITGVLDWESAMLGDPRTDLGYLLLHWHGGLDVNLGNLESTYSDEVIRDLETTNRNGLCPFSSEPGSPSRRELVVRYEHRTGIEFEHQRFYRAHAAFLLAMVWEDLNRHAVEAGSTIEAAPFVDYMALVAARIADVEPDEEFR